ncbi:MAG: DUF1800 family protein [Henriciella sp.]|nr:DUF1800 family protein [Henriciella sp.]
MSTIPIWKTACVAMLGLSMAACGGGGGGGDGGSTPVPPATGSPPPPAPAPSEPTQTEIMSEPDAVRFLSQASFGASKAGIASMQSTDAADWLAAEFAKPVTLTLPDVLALPLQSNGNPPFNATTYLYWDHLVQADDRLRQRMAFALSQILVYSDISNQSRQARRAYYQDVLIRNAFGNYRDLLEEVTYSPAMAAWLTYYRNRKGDPRSGRMPDENYAREILQLFSIGVVELNMDGTARLDTEGREIETYDNDDIVGLARVFTGLTGKGESFWRSDDDADYHPMVMWEEQHSELEKSFLGTTIPAGTSGEESIEIALDAIFEHPNVAPFVSRQLIQRFTASNPSPEYVERVARAFEAGSYTAENGRQFGTGERGDLEATLAAILLEDTLFVRDSGTAGADTTGKIREPILRFLHWVHAFDVQGIDAENERRLRNTSDSVSGLGQHPFRSPSVFNFYRPGYVAPGTQSGEAGMTAPELQIVDAQSTIGYLNFMTDFAFDRGGQADKDRRTFVADYTEELTMTDDFPALLDHLDLLLTGERMSDDEKTEIINILEAMPINTSTPEREDTDRLQIVQVAVSLVLNSPAFAVTW